MAQKMLLGVPKQYFIYPLIAIAITTFGFGIYMGRIHQKAQIKQPIINQDWKLYVSPEGWSIKHPTDVVAMKDNNFYGFAEEGAFFTEGELNSTLFSEENIHGSQIQIGVLPNSQKLTIEEWVNKWKEQYKLFCFCNVRPEGYNTPVTLGKYEGRGVEAGNADYSSYFIFLPVRDDRIVWANVSTNNQRDPSQWSLLLVKDMLASFKLY